MNSILLKDLMKHKIRKQILKRNKNLNHKAFVKSMEIADKIPFLMKYHKKKIIFFIVLAIVTWNYSLHKTAYHWFLGMRPPHKVLLGMFVDMPDLEKTVAELQMRKVQLSEQTKDILVKMHYETDKFMYFGLGRRYLFQVYKELGLLQTDQEQRMFYQKSDFYKKRNQLAAGVGLVQHLSVFEEAFKKQKLKEPQLTEESFRDQFIKKFIELAPEMMKWEREFNESREKEYIKNAPGLTEAKREVVSQILKENPSVGIDEMEKRLSVMGLRGLNTSDRFFYHRSQEVWRSMEELVLKKKLSHPTIYLNQGQKSRLQRQLEQVLNEKEDLNRMKEEDLKEYEKMYEKQLL